VPQLPTTFRAIERLIDQNHAGGPEISGAPALMGCSCRPEAGLLDDREFFGQQSLGTSGYVCGGGARRPAAPFASGKMQPGDCVVHRNHGIGRLLEAPKILAISGRIPRLPGAAIRRRHPAGGGRPSRQASALPGQQRRPTRSQPLAGCPGAGPRNGPLRPCAKGGARISSKLMPERHQPPVRPSPPRWPLAAGAEVLPLRAHPDQSRRSAMVKRDMERSPSDDRLVCGDCGLRQNQVAIRGPVQGGDKRQAAALLAPTTCWPQQPAGAPLSERFRPVPNRRCPCCEPLPQYQRTQDDPTRAQGRGTLMGVRHHSCWAGTSFEQLGLLLVDEERGFRCAAERKIKALAQRSWTCLTLSATNRSAPRST